MEGMEELVLLICMGSEQVVLALVQLYLGSFNGSGHAPLLCDQSGNFSVHVMVPLELSCNSPVFLSSGVVVHCCVHGVIGESFKEPIGEFPFFIDGDMLRGEQLMLVDGLIDANGSQAVQSILLDKRGKDMDGLVTVSDWDEEIKDISFVLFIPLWSSCLPLPFSIPSVHVHLPVLIDCFQMSHMHLVLCQILSLLVEYFQLFLIVAADFLILSHHSCQSLHDEEKFLSTWGAVPFESGAYGSRGELQLTKLMGGCHNHCWDGDRILSVDHWGVGLRLDGESFSHVHVDSEA